jgi:hypothetical protein
MMLVTIVVMTVMFVMSNMGVVVFSRRGVCLVLPVHLLGGPGEKPFKLSAVEPDTTAFPADIDGDSVLFPFFKGVFVASRTQHNVLLYRIFSGHQRVVPGVREEKLYVRTISPEVGRYPGRYISTIMKL